MNWSEEREAEFRGHYAEGIAHSEIAARMGITRNASIGKAHRLGLEQRAPRPKLKPWVKLGISERTWQRRLQKARGEDGTASRRREAKDWGAKMTEAVTEVGSGPLTLVDLHQHSCRWPVGGAGAETLFCGARKVDGHSYCAGHCQMAYVRLRAGLRQVRSAVYFSNARGRVG